ncbi:hypothetical protein GCM10010987_67230 [Bradyrhizobium guangdongense]|uniref:Uncharacterized protein n=1 Tax=Bradyrhizobium guangdongense TaxID=1325090 RepID=A0AA88BBT3_9BRAD|nr:hypothetical protein GCM10010987_67230 [Bradyrhizobium guangdongense]
MERGKLLMPLAHRKRLRGLDEAPGAFGILLDIHSFSFPRPAHGALQGTPNGIFIGFPLVALTFLNATNGRYQPALAPA